jgi:[ribosomal protein S5]-alanine N-acetyltransferase
MTGASPVEAAAETAEPADPAAHAFDPPAFDTERLQVRGVQPHDLPALQEVNGDDQVTRFLPYDRWQTAQDAQAWFDRMQAMQVAGTALQFVIVRRVDGLAIGTCLLFRFEATSARAEIGYVLGRAHWGQGLMAEALTGLVDCAFRRLNLRRLEAEVDPRNTASCRVLERVGFAHEGLLRQRWVVRGEACDAARFGLLRQAWPPSAAALDGDVGNGQTPTA